MTDCDDVLEKRTIRLRPETLEWYEAQARAVGLKFGVFMRLVLEARFDKQRIEELVELRRRA